MLLRQPLSPRFPPILKDSATSPRRSSASTSSTREPFIARMADRFELIVDFPSPGVELVTMVTRGGPPAELNNNEVRIAWNDSENGDLGCSATSILPCSDLSPSL